MNCPKCGVAVTADEKFCSGCGTGIAAGSDGTAILYDRVATPKVDLASGHGHLGTARKWLLAISIITLVSGLIFYGINKSEMEKQLRDAEVQLSHLTPAERDEALKQTVNMTWDEVVAHDRGLVNMLLAINIALSVIYFGLWFWAKKNAYAAALVALLLFLTVIVASAVWEPQTLYQGILIKILFIAALGKAVAAGREERRILGTT
ncbi:MAG: hypothetical protein ACKV2T_31185 [Kofleriaceae bacterium]